LEKKKTEKDDLQTFTNPNPKSKHKQNWWIPPTDQVNFFSTK
jgi:hypothetical protein